MKNSFARWHEAVKTSSIVENFQVLFMNFSGYIEIHQTEPNQRTDFVISACPELLSGKFSVGDLLRLKKDSGQKIAGMTAALLILPVSK